MDGAIFSMGVVTGAIAIIIFWGYFFTYSQGRLIQCEVRNGVPCEWVLQPKEEIQ